MRFPEVHDGYDRLGMVHEARGENRQAADCYRKVIAFVSEHPDDYDPGFEDVFVKLVNRLDLRSRSMRVPNQTALSRCRAASAKCRHLRNCQATATAVRHVVIAAARSTRCVWAEVRWRWTLKVL